MVFIEKLAATIAGNCSLLCIGLDPQIDKIPQETNVLKFNQMIIEATSDLVCAYKPNLAFYEELGQEGYGILKKTLESIPQEIPVIADAKLGDIGNTSKAYARAIFDELGADAVTVTPYLGYDSLEPFIKYRSKHVFILCRTSNPGSEDFQALKLKDGRKRLFERVAEKAIEWNSFGNIGLVVGATYPEEIGKIRQISPTMPLLIPGIGTQGGNLKAVVQNGTNFEGTGIIINSSRQILYASSGKDFAQASRKAAQQISDEINQYRRLKPWKSVSTTSST